jgi:hypothetical protein
MYTVAFPGASTEPDQGAAPDMERPIRGNSLKDAAAEPSVSELFAVAPPLILSVTV